MYRVIAVVYHACIHKGLSAIELPLGLLHKRGSNQPAQLQRLATLLKFSMWHVNMWTFLVSEQQQCRPGCADWSAPKLFACSKASLSCVVTHTCQMCKYKVCTSVLSVEHLCTLIWRNKHNCVCYNQTFMILNSLSS